MKGKYFYQDHKKDIEEEHKKYKALSETKDLDTTRCDHMGKVSYINGELRCKCGASWSGANLSALYDFFKK